MRAEILSMKMFLLSFVILGGGIGAAHVQATPLTDEEKLRQCDRDICGVITNPDASGAALQCDLRQTFSKEDIKKAVEKGRLSWPWGDARCNAKFEYSRALFAAPFKQKSYTLKLPPQPVACEIDNSGSRHELRAKMAPVIAFESGKAKSVSLGVTDIEGTALVRNAVWAAWKFENTFGYFQADFIKGVNEYITEHCPKENARAN